MSQSPHEVAVEAFLTAQEPITVEVLRRPSTSKTASSVPVSHRNSTYIPPKSPSGCSLKETSAQTEVVFSNHPHDHQHVSNHPHDHEFIEEDEEMLAGSEDLLVPGLDYEVRF